MSRKLTDRALSRLAAGSLREAYLPFRGLEGADVEHALSEYRLRRQRALVNIIAREGVLGALRRPPGYSELDLERLARAWDLVHRDAQTPEDFVSKRSDAAARSDRTRHQENRRGRKYVGLDDLVKEVLAREKFRSPYPGWTGAALMAVREAWRRRHPDKDFPKESTIRGVIKRLAG